MDPRKNVIDKRLKKVKKIIAVSGGKGGIGKSTTAATLALVLSKKGYKVGLLDLDFWGPSTHIILGMKEGYPEEEKGIVPPEVSGVKFMSIVYYNEDEALALRRAGFDHAAIELFAITQWGSLDYLIIDMPPGIGDATLDVIRLMKKVNFCILTTQSKVVLETVKKTLKLLKELQIPIIGIIENMKTNQLSAGDELKEFNAPFLGEIDFDPQLETAVGDTEKILKTNFANNLNKILISRI